jgi:predicted nucleic acid-binding protein
LTRGYLLDTSVTSTLAPRRTEDVSSLVEWMGERNELLFLSTVTVFEATQGIAKLERQQSAARAGELSAWLETLIQSFGPRVLAVDLDVARRAGRMAHQAIAEGRHPGVADVLIAATANAHDLLLLTQNIKHFGPLGIAVADPFVSLPD